MECPPRLDFEVDRITIEAFDINLPAFPVELAELLTDIAGEFVC